jgi:hypothetical protein
VSWLSNHKLLQDDCVTRGVCTTAVDHGGAKNSLREPRPEGFPLFFTDSMEIIEPVVAFLHEHAIQRAHTADTVRTYAEILFDWFDTLEQSSIAWDDADGADLVAYRNRMLSQSSPIRVGHMRLQRSTNGCAVFCASMTGQFALAGSTRRRWQTN